MIPPHAKRVFEGVLFDVYQWEQELFDGTTTTFEKLKRNNSAIIIPVLEDGKLLMTLDEQPGRDAVLTFPSGHGEDDDDDIQTTAHRELLEETGYTVQELIPWKIVRPSSKIDWELHYFIARGCKKTGEQNLDAGEKITPRIVTLDDVLALADDVRFQNTGIAIELLKARYDDVARREFEKLLYGE